DHEAIPGDEDLVVPSRRNPALTDTQQLLTRRPQSRFDALARAVERGGNVLHRAEDVQMPATLEVGLAIEAIAGSERLEFLRRQGRAHLVPVPDIVLSLVSFRVGIQARVVAAFGRLHFAPDPVGGLCGHTAVEAIAR